MFNKKIKKQLTEVKNNEIDTVRRLLNLEKLNIDSKLSNLVRELDATNLHLKAIINFLEIKFEEELVQDYNYILPEPKMTRRLKAIKLLTPK